MGTWWRQLLAAHARVSPRLAEMESKIAQSEQSIVSVVKAYMYDEIVDDMKGMETLNYNDIVIGK